MENVIADNKIMDANNNEEIPNGVSIENTSYIEIGGHSDGQSFGNTFLDSIIKACRLELKMPSDKKPVASVTQTWMRKKAIALASALEASAFVSLNMDSMNIAREQLEEAYNLVEGEDKQISTSYGNILFKTRNISQARKVLEKIVSYKLSFIFFMKITARCLLVINQPKIII